MRRPSPPAPWALAPPPPAFQRHAPQKPPPSGSPARPRGLPGGAEPTRLRQPMSGWGKPHRSPQPGGIFAILIAHQR